MQENGRYDILEAVKRVSMYNIPSVDKASVPLSTEGTSAVAGIRELVQSYLIT